MKKWLSILVAIALMTSMTALCMAEAVTRAVPSKTTSDVSQVVGVESATGETLPDTFRVEVTEDAEPVIREIEKLYNFVNNPENPEPVAPIKYFPEEVQQQVAEQLVQQGMPEDYDTDQLELNEFVTVQEIGYEEQYGDVVAKFQVATKYQVGQKMVSLMGFYTGEVDENGNDVVDWVTVEAWVQEDGTVAVKLTQEQLLRFKEVAATALAILSEPMPETEGLN